MERHGKIKYIVRVFTFLVKETVSAQFSFPGGGLSCKALNTCLDTLEESYGRELSEERLSDYCICQVFAISGFPAAYTGRWKVSHSFGTKAITRFCRNTRNKRFLEDRWLGRHGLSRRTLLDRFGSRKEHPLARFIYPEYEEPTKRRLLGREAGFYICLLSTLLWTPFSPACSRCRHAGRCQGMTQRKYEELYRIRKEAYEKATGR